MKVIRVSATTCMVLYLVASCIIFATAALYVLRDMFTSHGIIMLRLLLLFLTELSMACIFTLAAYATVKGWRTRDRWGIAASLLSVCAPFAFLFWGASAFWRYLACLWPAWLFGAVGFFVFSNAGRMPHSLAHDLRTTLGKADGPGTRGSTPATK